MLTQLQVETAERHETQEENLSSYTSDDSAISSSRHQSSSQQEENLLASGSLEVEVDTKEDSPPPSTRRSGRAKVPSRKIQSQQRRDQSQQRRDLKKKTAKEAKATQKERSVRKGGKAKVRVEMITQFEDTMQEFGVNLTITSSSQYSSSE